MVLGELSDISSADPDLFRPDGVVPFAIAEMEARARAARWIQRSWFAPSKLARCVRTESLQRVYRPLWMFDARAVGYWTGSGAMRGIFEMDFFNVPISAERAADPNWLSEIEPAAIKAARPYALREIGLIAVAGAQRG